MFILCSLIRRALCQIESKAFSRSRRICCVNLFLFISRVMCFITRCSCWMQECPETKLLWDDYVLVFDIS